MATSPPWSASKSAGPSSRLGRNALSGAKRDKKKKSFTVRVDKRIQAAVTKALEEQANGTTSADQGQAGTSSPGSAKPPPAASQATTVTKGAAAVLSVWGQLIYFFLFSFFMSDLACY